jgi:ectoine hydroxylase-related dioxygenase (phytanoyl-CoA dioxygenase family)
MTDTAAPLRPVTQDEIDAFWHQGFVCLRQVIPPGWIARMQRALEVWLATPECLDYSAYGASVAEAAGAIVMLEAGERRGRFLNGIDHWKGDDDFRAFAMHSPLVAITASLLRSAKLNLYEDSVLVKEPGTLEKTAFHQDISYFNVEGSQVCTTWTPLDPVRAETGSLKFIPGSHLWKKKFRPNFFTTELAIPDTEGEVVPDYHKSMRSTEVVCYDMEPGDITVHHARTLHGADGNSSLNTRRRAISVRYCGDDARYHIRRGVLPKPHHAEVVEGQVLDHPDCPVVWRGEG